MKGYAEQLDRLGYVLLQDLSVRLIMNSLNCDCVGFVRNYNMHNMGKKIGKLQALLIEYKKGLPKKAATPQVMAIQSEHPTKDEACYHCKEVGHWKSNCHAYLAELIKKKKQVGTTSSSCIFTIELFSFPNKSRVYNTGCGTYICNTKHGVRGDYALEYVTHIHDKTPYELGYKKVPKLSYLKIRGCEALVKRDTPDKLQQRSVKYIFIGYPKETIASGRAVELDEIQDEDTSPSENTSEIPMIDYKETFSLVVIIRAIRILIAITAFYDYEIWKIDVKTAFLNGYLDEDIYMVQPKGFVDPKHPRKVCKLQRSIYGLKQASKTWNKRFDKEIKKKCFTMKDLGEAAFILGIKIYRDTSKRLIRLSKSAYLDKILKRYRMDNSKRCNIPMQERRDLNKTQVDWKSSKQSTTTMFATEAKDIVALEAAIEAVWIRKFISGLGIVPTINEPIKMFCDNSAALLIANEPRVQKGARHYHRRYHYVRECIELGEIIFLKFTQMPI
nr:hypothetical protein [Tanacetum cinerariifolium]